MPIYPVLNFRLSSCFASLLIIAALAMPASGQTVWVDFTSDFQDGYGGPANGISDWIDELTEVTDRRGFPSFIPEERVMIESIIISELTRIYAGTNIEFVTSQPSGDHDVIYLGADNSRTNSFGVAAGDAGNRNTSTYAEVFPNGNPNILNGRVPKVFTGNLISDLGFEGSHEENIQGFANSIARVAAHELGHGFGLLHHYVYSAEGISPSNYSNTGGLQTQHTINTGSTGGSSALRIAGGSTLSPFSKVLIDIAGGSRYFQRFSFFDNTPLVDNPVMSDDSEQLSGDAGDTLETAQTLTFATGTLSGKEISFVEADLDGGASDVDLFRFDISFETILSAHVLSEQLNLGTDEFDPTLKLLDATGNELAFADDVNWLQNNLVVDQSVPASANDSSFSQDAGFFNITLAAGTYYLEVKPAQVDIGQAPASGDIYWLLTSLEPLGVSDFLGDVNQDGFVNFLDIAPFITILSVGGFEAQADINQDGEVDFLDIAPFISILSS